MLPVSNYRQNTLATGKDRLDFDKCTKVRDVQQRFGASHKPMISVVPCAKRCFVKFALLGRFNFA